MDFQIRHGSAVLAMPAVTREHLQAQPLVVISVQAQSLGFGQAGHAASVISERNSSFWAAGRKRNKRSMEHKSTFGSPFSRCAPAKKSAQIISRQYPRDLSLPSINAAVSSACSITGIWLL